MSQLFTSVRIGSQAIPNRLVMAPMTRSRADDAGVPDDVVVTYYAQRSGAGLIISEGVFPPPQARAMCVRPAFIAMPRWPHGSVSPKPCMPGEDVFSCS